MYCMRYPFAWLFDTTLINIYSWALKVVYSIPPIRSSCSWWDTVMCPVKQVVKETRQYAKRRMQRDSIQCSTTRRLLAQCSPPGERCRGWNALMFVCCVRGVSHVDFCDEDVCDAAKDRHKVENVPGVLQVVLGWAGKQTTTNNNETKKRHSG